LYKTGATEVIASAAAVAVNTKVNTPFDPDAATPIASDVTTIDVQRSSNPGVDTFTAQGSIRAVVYYMAFEEIDDV